MGREIFFHKIPSNKSQEHFGMSSNLNYGSACERKELQLTYNVNKYTKSYPLCRPFYQDQTCC